MNDNEINFWLDLSEKISQNVENAIQNSKNDPEINSITKIGADGTPTHKIDEYAENSAIETIKSTGKSLILISEEIGTIKIGDDRPENVIIMDPLDGTTNAMKNIPCYGISLAIAKLDKNKTLDDITLGDIEIGFVKNFPTNDTYIAVKGKGSLKNNKPIEKSDINQISEATVCNYIYREKKDKIAKLCSSVRRMRLMGAISVELCYVSDGTYDIFLDTGSVRLLDIAAAQLILKENNGIVTDTENNVLASSLDLMEKTSIISSSNKEIHEEIMKLLK